MVASARSVITRSKKTHKRQGSVTKAEKDLVAAVVADSPREMTPGQTRALATALRRTTDTVKGMIAEAKGNFQKNAQRYVDLHMQGVEQAMANGDSKSLDAGLRAASWAIENMSGEGERIVDQGKADKGFSGPRIAIGINLAGVDMKKLEGVQIVEIPPSFEPTENPK